MTCCCSEFGPVELKRKAINIRICHAKQIKATLTLLARSGEGEELLRCWTCETLWQSNRDRQFKGECLFQVPLISPEDWQSESYAFPAALFSFTSTIQGFADRNCGQETQRSCGAPGCGCHAIEWSKFCLQHHVQMLQKSRLLPSMPRGRLLEPYQGGGEMSKYLREASR